MIKNITIPKPKTPPADAVNGLGADANFGTGCRTGTLEGKFLVATPSMQETNFTRAVIYLCSHNEQGAMGIIVNYPVKNVGIEDILEQLDIKTGSKRSVPIHFGGPVESNRGFIIHSDDFSAAGTIYQHGGMSVTSNAEVLKAIADGSGPKQGMLAMGYTGWGAGQLETEMEAGNWIVVSASKQLLFDTDNDMKWKFAIATLGFDVGHFSTSVGHA